MELMVRFWLKISMPSEQATGQSSSLHSTSCFHGIKSMTMTSISCKVCPSRRAKSIHSNVRLSTNVTWQKRRNSSVYWIELNWIDLNWIELSARTGQVSSWLGDHSGCDPCQRAATRRRHNHPSRPGRTHYHPMSCHRVTRGWLPEKKGMRVVGERDANSRPPYPYHTGLAWLVAWGKKGCKN